jgi:hypothetical protein
MIDNKKSDEQQFIESIERARYCLLGSNSAKFGDCENVSIAISKILFSFYPDIQMIDGRYEGCTNAIARCHVWCYIPSKKIMIDGTFDQFNPRKKFQILKSNNPEFFNYKELNHYTNIPRFFNELMFNNIK